MKSKSTNVVSIHDERHECLLQHDDIPARVWSMTMVRTRAKTLQSED